MEDLTNSPHLLVDSSATFEVVIDSDSIASFMNSDVNSLDYFLSKSTRRAHIGGRYAKPGEIAWIKAPSNASWYHLYCILMIAKIMETDIIVLKNGLII